MKNKTIWLLAGIILLGMFIYVGSGLFVAWVLEKGLGLNVNYSFFAWTAFIIYIIKLVINFGVGLYIKKKFQ